MKAIQALVAIAIAFLSLNVFADALWMNTASGMSIEEVKRLQPDAVDRAASPERSLRTGAAERLVIEKFLIFDQPFQVQFYFKDDKLEQVTLSFKGADLRDERPSVDLYDRVTEALRSKYGPELAKERRRDSLGTSASATWMSGKTSIKMNLISGSIFVFYSTSLAKEADKL